MHVLVIMSCTVQEVYTDILIFQQFPLLILCQLFIIYLKSIMLLSTICFGKTFQVLRNVFALTYTKVVQHCLVELI